VQWLQHPSKINGDNVNNMRHEVSRHFRNKNGEYLNELAMNSKDKNIRDMCRGTN
jgi:hypothetical protein